MADQPNRSDPKVVARAVDVSTLTHGPLVCTPSVGHMTEDEAPEAYAPDVRTFLQYGP